MSLVICVLSLLVAGALAQPDLGSTAGEYVPANQDYIYEAGGERPWNAAFDQSHYLPASYYFYSVPTQTNMIQQELRYVGWSSFQASGTGGHRYEYVVGWTPHCVPGSTSTTGNCGFAGYQLDVSQLPSTWSELRVTKPRNFEATFNKPVSVDIGNEIAWSGSYVGSIFQAGSSDFWYTLWYVDSAGKAYQMQCYSTTTDANGNDQFQPPVTAADTFTGCTDTASGVTNNAWVQATIPYADYDSAHTYKLWHVSSGGRKPGSSASSAQSGCNVALIDTQLINGFWTNSSFTDANGNKIKKGHIWWGNWQVTGDATHGGPCGGAFVAVGGDKTVNPHIQPDTNFISVGLGYDTVWAIQDNGGTPASSTLRYYAYTSAIPSFSSWTSAGWTASTQPIQVDSYDCERTYVIDNAYGLWRATSSFSGGSCSVTGWTQVISYATDNVKALDISVGPISAYVTLLTSTGEKQFRLDH